MKGKNGSQFLVSALTISKDNRYNIQNQVEHLQMKYIGTGHADFTKWYLSGFKCIELCREWGTNMNRDSLASHLGHHSRLVYFSLAENQTVARMKYNFIMVTLILSFP